MIQAILQEIERLSNPIPLPPDLGFLAPDPAVRQFKGDAGQLRGKLLKRFPIETLEQSGIAYFGPERNVYNLHLNCVLQINPVEFCVLRQRPEDPPFDLVTNAGCLTTSDPPCFTACEDALTEQWARRYNFVLMAQSIRDVAVLRALQLPATVATGLTSMNGRQYRALCGLPQVLVESTTGQQHVGDSVATADGCRRAHKLIAVGWQPATLSNPGLRQVRTLAHNLTTMNQHFQFAVDSMKIWAPSEPQLSSIKTAVMLQDWELLLWAMRYSLTHVYTPQQYLQPGPPEVRVSWHDARTAFAEQCRRASMLHDPVPDLRKALEHYRACFVAEFIQPIMADLADTPDPHRRVYLFGVQELAEKLFAVGESVLTVTNKIEGIASPQESRKPLADLKAYGEMVEKLGKLINNNPKCTATP